ncbi:LOW QUALITY PROTEIN: U3 small nucleolar RNA-associated protein 14 homolog A-like [Homalodisca vitripennis]|uniref:LOW QUALITY PROTEIN: U3 small nucleolar RNA-associated protein 14 homolog A-like n=1 Tax=Homalodisca vitripennis TaxID=197043 RepID=UPI001EEB36F6|nr:LOW QUALITY PROTEIN: U3 small nucleolar RNA-associated protein 14 homolog A-like [Homalodisca vitripennis]
MFRKPTELELELSKLLKEPKPFTQEEETQDNKDEAKEEDYPMSLAEVREKRKMMARLRAQQSYKQAKAMRHSKIKSKKFHQIQRRARVKQQLKEFEELQQKDPEAALKKLEELEKTRAQERVTLRHRSTGQWAKNLAVRAKYDKDARIALAEQLAKSRELTVKLAKNKESESEKEEEEEEEEEPPQLQQIEEDGPNNEWLVKQSKEMVDFVSGYRKYWETKVKKQENEAGSDTEVKGNNIPCSNESEMENPSEGNTELKQDKIKPLSNVENKSSEGNTELEQNKIKALSNVENKSSEGNTELEKDKIEALSNFENKSSEGNTELEQDKIKDLSNVENKSSKSLKKNVQIKNLFFMSDSSVNTNAKAVHNKTASNFKVSSSNKNAKPVHNKTASNFKVSKSTHKNKTSKKNSDSLATRNGFKNFESKMGSWIVTKHSQVKGRKIKNIGKDKGNEKRIKISSGTYEIMETRKRHNTEVVPEHPGEVGETNGLYMNTQKAKKVKSLDEMFEEVEEKLQNKVQEKLNQISKQLDSKLENKDNNEMELETDEIPSLKMNRQNITADVDEELAEETRVNNKRNRVERDVVAKAIATASAKVTSGEDIDPNKFQEVTPRLLASELPEMVTEGEEAMDQEDQAAKDRHLVITEAFAESDVVEQFQKEKEDETSKSAVGDVNLSLPGWGSWAGHNLKPVTRRKRKKFVIKFPRVIPRRDANRGNVILNEDADKPIKEHQVSEVPFPFTSVQEYEASMRAPLGSTWVPQTAHKKLTRPALITKLGTIISPMDEDQLVAVNKQKKLPKRKPQNVMRKNHITEVKK